jgi:thiosulfate dehydrogenase (quinone) large subunit
MERRTLLLRAGATAALGAAGAVAAGLVTGIGRLVGGTPSRAPASLASGSPPPPTAATTTTTAPPPGSPSSSASPSTAPPTTQAPRPPGTRVGAASQVPVGGVASFDDPATGDPSLVVQPVRGTFLAFDAVCPHAGCPVQYFSDQRRFICPCHGSEFNGHTGAVEVGPAETGLTRIRIAEGPDGQLYAR